VTSRTRTSRTKLPQEQDQEEVEGHQIKPDTNLLFQISAKGE
jgi:hypothetical protein